jgi:hypothetical protein
MLTRPYTCVRVYINQKWWPSKEEEKTVRFLCVLLHSHRDVVMLSIQPGFVLDCFGIYPYSRTIHITIDVTCYTGSPSQHRKTYQTLYLFKSLRHQWNIYSYSHSFLVLAGIYPFGFCYFFCFCFYIKSPIRGTYRFHVEPRFRKDRSID